MRLFRIVLAALTVAVATWTVNAHTFDFGFVYDDRAVILERTPAWEQGWNEFLWDRPWGLGRHLTALSLDLDRTSFMSPRTFHRTNVVLAASVAVGVLALGLSLGLGLFAAFSGALLFTVHPLHVDAVVSIVGRAELLAAAFVLAIVLLHVHRYPPRGASLILAGLLLLAALESKESAAVALLLMAVFDFAFARRSGATLFAYPTYVLALAAWLLFVGDRFAAGADIAFIDNPLVALPVGERVLASLEILWRYVGLLLWPADLKADRAFAETLTSVGGGWVAALGWLGVLALALRLRSSRPSLTFLLLWFPAAFAITANLAFPIGTVMAERLVFLPSIGPALLAGQGLATLAKVRVLRFAAVPALALAAFTLGFAYHARSLIWTSDPHFHRQTATDAPHSAKAHYNHALSLAGSGAVDEAAAAFRRALAVHGDFFLAADYLARLLREQGKLAEAARTYLDYLEHRPDDPRALAPAADLLGRVGRHREGRELAERLVEIEPGDAGHIMLLNRLESGQRAFSP